MKGNRNLQHPRLFKIWLTSLLALLVSVAGQAQTVEARLTSVTPPATLTRNARGFTVRKGDQLLPGDALTTGARGRCVIALSDGSVVSIAAHTRVVLKDFRQPGNLRELLEVTAGRLRVKINKLGGRPNPYRINSPTASIAVRGTEFTVRVSASGETAVAVSEGLVEVVSLRDPAQRRLVEPGRNVIVRPNGDLSWRLPGPGGELEAQLRPLSEQASPYYRAAAEVVALSLTEYQRAVTEKSFNNLPVRLAAFADGAFDSLLNPAYAAQFTRSAGRVYLLPTLSAPLVQVYPAALRQAADAPLLDSAASAQASYFTPLGTRWVLGGGLAVTRTQVESLTRQQTREERLGLTRTNTLTGALAAAAGNVSLVAARSFGPRTATGGRRSLGFKLEYTHSRAAAETLEENREELPSAVFLDRFFTDVAAHSHRTTATLGLLQSFARGDKLGVSYSYGTAAGGEQHERDSVQAAFGNPLAQRTVTARTAELAVVLRGPLTRRLFYGVEGAWLRERVSEAQARRTSSLTEQRRVQRPRAGAGIGFALRPRTFLSADVSFVQRRVRADTSEQSQTELARDAQRTRASFINGHFALQTDLGRRFLASAAVLRVYERRYVEWLELREQRRYTFAQFGLGWRLRPGWLAQYFFSTADGPRGPSHTLVLRYAFGGSGQ